MSNLVLSSSRHCGPSSFGHTISSFETRARAINSLATSPALMVLPRPTSSASSVTGRRRQNVMSLVTWWWQEHLEPYHHQVTNLITFCRRLPVTLLADDVGLGKTISAGLVASELIARARVSKLLIVCPKLLGPQWRDELKTKFDIPAEIATGRKLIDAEPEDVGAVITTYASARLHLDKLPEDRFQMLVLDEAHKLRNLYGVDPPPQVAVRFKKALEERRFRYVLMLTATPIQNRLWDL